VNDKPIKNKDTATTNEDSPVDIAVLSNDTDPDGNSLVVSSVADAPHGSTSVNPDGTIRYTPDPDYNGTDSFTYTISDGAGGSATGTVNVTIIPVNDAPTIAPVADQKGIVGTPVSPVTVVGKDVDRDALTYSEAGLPPGLNIDRMTGKVTGTPTKAGDYPVTVSVFDASASASTNFMWHIDPAPAVTLENPGPQKTLEGEFVRLPLVTNAPPRDGAGNHRRFSATGLPPGLHINHHRGVIFGHLGKRSAGVYDVEATVSLGGASATVKFQWTVVDTNRPPVITPPKNQKNFEHDSVRLEIQATDPDDDRLEYSATGLPPGLRIHSHSGVIEGHLPLHASAGTYTVTVTVSDGSKTAQATFTWTVIDPNRPPVIKAPKNQQNYEHDSVSLDINASDPDWDPLQYSATGLPPGLTIHPRSGVITGHLPPDASAGRYVVTVTVSDGYKTAQATFNWTVLEHRPPVIKAPTDQHNFENDSVLLNIYAMDPEGEPLQYSATGLPPGLAISSRTGVIAGRLAPNASAGNYTVTVTASDGSKSASDTFKWVVASLSPPKKAKK